ncbi:MAG: hypothetical protein ACI837_001354 [Crocinitomicaceae bacterium]|jgi:hypothetical protein
MNYIVTTLFIFFLGNLMAQNESCLDFDGVDDYVFVGDVNDLGLLNFTIEAWVYVEGTSGIGNKIINKGCTSVGTPSNAGYGLRTSKTAADELEFHLGHSDGSSTRVLYIGLVTDQWVHMAGVREQNTAYLYINGVLVAQESTGVVYNVDTNVPLTIGAMDKLGMFPVAEFMDGKIDEVRIWNVARTVDEIIANMDCAIASPQTNLLAVYNLNETSGILASDASGFNNAGGLISSPVWVASTVALACNVEITESQLEETLVVPNPFDSEISIENPSRFDNYSLIDMTGKIVQKGMLTSAEISVLEINAGSYLLVLNQGNQVVSRVKVLKK